MAGGFPAATPPTPRGRREIFPKPLIDETLKQTARDLTRFDLDFDLPDHLLPELPAAVFLATRPDLGDVSKGELITLDNFERLFKEILNESVSAHEQNETCQQRRDAAGLHAALRRVGKGKDEREPAG